MYNLLLAKYFPKDYNPAFLTSVALQLGYEVEEFIAARTRGEGHDVWEMLTKEKVKQCERLFRRYKSFFIDFLPH